MLHDRSVLALSSTALASALLLASPARAQGAATVPGQAGTVADGVPLAAGAAPSGPAGASAKPTGGAAAAIGEDIVVTATKRGQPESVQKVGFAVTAFGSRQLDAINFKSIETLSFSMPNVALDANNSSPGFANFSIRGQGLGSSIPSLEGAVGVFVDGIYLGLNSGIVFDNFDLEGIEVLRGPQGVLFGKNVTGGAVVLRTKRPTDTFHADARLQVESGPMWTADAAISGPIVKGTLDAKLAVYYNKDEGYFHNSFDDSSFGKQRTVIVRPALTWTPTEDVDATLRYEHGDISGQGAAAHNLLNGRHNYYINIDNPGFTDAKWDQAILEANWRVPFGGGAITNIAGYRKYFGDTEIDLDALPMLLFNSEQYVKQNQFSNELRYAGTFGPAKVTTGLYYFDSHLFFIDHRTLAGGTQLFGGGDQRQKTYGIFGAVDYSITDKLILNLGARYTYESKKVQISTVRVNGCSIASSSCNYTIFDKANWKAFTPKVGLQYYPVADTQLYAFYARGFRGGGYNFRNTNPLVPAGPFDNENQDTYEAGLKTEAANGLLRFNLAAFVNKIKGVQRAVQTPVAGVGISQVIINAGDATIRGAEGELTLRPSRSLTVSANVGYLHGKYDKILYDLSGNNTLGPEDLALKLIRLSPWTYGGSVNYDLDVADAGVVSSRLSYSHRDKAFATENNVGYFDPIDYLDFDLSFRPAGSQLTVSFYGRNLFNDVAFGLVSPLGVGGPGSTFGDLKKGRVFGGSIRWRL